MSYYRARSLPETNQTLYVGVVIGSAVSGGPEHVWRFGPYISRGTAKGMATKLARRLNHVSVCKVQMCVPEWTDLTE